MDVWCRRGGRGRTQHSGGGTGGIREFIPTTLEVALIEGYDNVVETSLKPAFPAQEVESCMWAVAMCNTEASIDGGSNEDAVRAVTQRNWRVSLRCFMEDTPSYKAILGEAVSGW